MLVTFMGQIPRNWLARCVCKFVCLCVCACVRACVRACVLACMLACMRVRACVYLRGSDDDNNDFSLPPSVSILKERSEVA